MRVGVDHRQANPIENAVGVLDDVVVPEPQHPIACLLEARVPDPVYARLQSVMTAVELNDDSTLRATEVSD